MKARAGEELWALRAASLTPNLTELPLLLHQHSWAHTAYRLTKLLLPKIATFQLPELGLPWLHKHPYSWGCGTLPQLSSPWSRTPAELLPKPEPSTSPHPQLIKTISNFITAVISFMIQLKHKVFISFDCVKSLKYGKICKHAKLSRERAKIFQGPTPS